MPLDHYNITLGRSGLRVSPFCLGAMMFGEDLGWVSSVEESEAILDRYIELGCTIGTAAPGRVVDHLWRTHGSAARREREVVEVQLTAEQTAALDELTTHSFRFPFRSYVWRHCFMQEGPQ